jgi:hypothetical protein
MLHRSVIEPIDIKVPDPGAKRKCHLPMLSMRCGYGATGVYAENVSASRRRYCLWDYHWLLIANGINRSITPAMLSR